MIKLILIFCVFNLALPTIAHGETVELYYNLANDAIPVPKSQQTLSMLSKGRAELQSGFDGINQELKRAGAGYTWKTNISIFGSSKKYMKTLEEWVKDHSNPPRYPSVTTVSAKYWDAYVAHWKKSGYQLPKDLVFIRQDGIPFTDDKGGVHQTAVVSFFDRKALSRSDYSKVKITTPPNSIGEIEADSLKKESIDFINAFSADPAEAVGYTLINLKNQRTATIDPRALGDRNQTMASGSAETHRP